MTDVHNKYCIVLDPINNRVRKLLYGKLSCIRQEARPAKPRQKFQLADQLFNAGDHPDRSGWPILSDITGDFVQILLGLWRKFNLRDSGDGTGR
jgi:hypothetical protein